MKLKYNEFENMLLFHGRTVADDDNKAMYFNWSCSGFTVRFTGTHLTAKIQAQGDKIAPMPAVPFPETDYPCFGISVDGGELCCRNECRDSETVYELFKADEAVEHTVRIIKLSENARGKLGLAELETDGEFLPAESSTELNIEFIGDSITCGFGNEAENNSPVFKTTEENGWMSHTAIAARKLNAEWSMISESGICCTRPEKPMFDAHAMDEIYAYTDELYDSKRGLKPAKWNFEMHRKDVVVINLGTNDANNFLWYTDYSDTLRMEQWFRDRYKSFVENVRELNGKEALIVCALGTMDYFLYDSIKTVVEGLQSAGDPRIRVFKYVGINPITEGYGAVGHPAMLTQKRMAEELVCRLKEYLGE